ncbi:MAG: lipid-A-disaccharide synthase N-terminal domain-containing protein [Phycisphaerales bacterium]
MKWEPLFAMAALLVLGVWLVAGLAKPVSSAELRAGASVLPFTIGNSKGVLEGVSPTPDQPERTYRLLFRSGASTDVLTESQLEPFLPREHIDRLNRSLKEGRSERRAVFRVLNITDWWGILWVSIGFLGQAAFFGRMFVQWVVSEKQGRSTIPEIFWWLSLLGGLALFTYFVWRQDIVGVIGQTTGVVIYARNLRLISKRRKRVRRQVERARQRRANSDDAQIDGISLSEAEISAQPGGFVEADPESDR